MTSPVSCSGDIRDARTSRELADALATISREIAVKHGDEAAQKLVYALFLRRVEPEARVADLVEAFPDQSVIARIESILDSTDLAVVFARYAAEGKDPAIYFFEEFVRACDPANSRKRGVHYSPPAVVSYMVRGVESILRTRFGLDLAHAAVLDPCCGIGTFLRCIEKTACHLSYGMELMPVACDLAGRLLSTSEITQGDALCQTGIFAAGVSGFELRSRRGVSGFPLRSNPETPAHGPLVVIGNPPYSGHSANAGKMVDLLADYRAGLDERNPKWLQDDYVKFTRIAQHWVDLAGLGIVAFITNHSFIFNPTFRAMRESLMRSFDELYFLDLHGNAKLVERGPDGEPDENVFPIRMGVAISFMVKTGAPSVILNAVKNPDAGREILRYAQNDVNGQREAGPCRVYQSDLRGTREHKLRALSEMEFETTPWTEITPSRPFLLFTPQNGNLQAEYARFASLFDIFRETSVGFVTSRDAFAIDCDRNALLDRIAALRDDGIPPNEIRARYPVGDLDIDHAREMLQADPCSQDRAVEVLYRPFDCRWAYLSRAVMERPRLPFMESMLRDNTALAIGRAGRATGSDEWDVVFCADHPTDLNLFRRGGAMLFPRWVYRDSERQSNIIVDTQDPDRLFSYIYAVLHSAAYRDRYRELLMIDFPRIPIARDPELFEALASLGGQLLRVHGLKPGEPASGIHIPDDQQGGIHVPDDQMLRIGGYRIPERYLHDRKGRDLSPAEAQHYNRIREAVARTITIRTAIDELLRISPPWN